MQVVTTHNNPQGSARQSVKPFTWSYSKLKNFESCPKRHWHVDIARDVKEEESDDLKWGNALHKAAAEHLSKNRDLPEGMEVLEKWCTKLVTPPGNILVEQKFAITRDFGPTEWFAKNVWYRGIADVLKIVDDVALAIDWKTGKIKEDGAQLALMAACVFAHHPNVHKIRTEFVWLAHDASSRCDFARSDMPGMWRGLWPRIEQLEHAHNTMSYPAKPGFLCRNWCPVKQCPHHGE